MTNTEKATKLRAAAEAILYFLQDDEEMNIRLHQSIDDSESPYIIIDYGFKKEPMNT